MLALDTTRLLLLVCLFAGVFGLSLGAMYIFAPKTMRRRIEQAGGGRGTPVPSAQPDGADEPWYERLVQVTEPLSRLSTPKEGWEVSALRVRLMNAGWRTPGAVAIYFGARTVLALLLPTMAAMWMLGGGGASSVTSFALVLVSLVTVGYYLPAFILSRVVARRKRAIFEDFPDAIDLLTVCVEAGLGLDAALMRVAEEIKLRSVVVASEMELTLLEMRSGYAKEKALRNFALRTGVEDVDSFSTMLIQAERFGTSIGDSLRVLSDTLRTRRRMLAEEKAAKIALKLLFPLMFCIFPALLVVLMGPAMLQIYRTMLPALSS
ncbi:type II secretion system F family protein [Paraburkholderia silviterrae]|uniref:Type II secretion system F family protein n=1 Tax=Paraburkholderia silviterrae TaxID=2528715 RepID=A0A4R5LYM9_9BURK|nr:type II secretion system F family protein [Paraburkholderia silviterrae]TDG17236.1 type II secretion system F family protein [Paraburkholderia silviterrae]